MKKVKCVDITMQKKNNSICKNANCGFAHNILELKISEDRIFHND